ncbi:hypothetical protein LCGC14_1251490 [marine sediment metagenome]|uniref:Uncharacterized protein n=1 Tax=marine sediment metagenome TaxID=412755 RepID=A0A0F9L6I6_9ZZZZ
MKEPLYDFACSDTFRDHELWWQGEGLYSEPRERFPIEPPVQEDDLRERITLLENWLGELEETSHTHSHKKKDDYIIQ